MTKKPTQTQRKILETAAGIACLHPKGRSESGGWGASYLVCLRNGWLDRSYAITDAGRAAIGLAPAPAEIGGE